MRVGAGMSVTLWDEHKALRQGSGQAPIAPLGQVSGWPSIPGASGAVMKAGRVVSRAAGVPRGEAGREELQGGPEHVPQGRACVLALGAVRAGGNRDDLTRSSGRAGPI
jgi:hypothetical protein